MPRYLMFSNLRLALGAPPSLNLGTLWGERGLLCRQPRRRWVGVYVLLICTDLTLPSCLASKLFDLPHTPPTTADPACCPETKQTKPTLPIPQEQRSASVRRVTDKQAII